MRRARASPPVESGTNRANEEVQSIMQRVLLTDDADLDAFDALTSGGLDRLQRLKERYLEIVERKNGRGVEVCIERAKLITDSMRDTETSDEPMILRRARAIHHYLSNRDVTFHDENLLAGATTSKAMGAPVYPELLGMSIWPELDSISDRMSNPQHLSRADADTLNLEVFPYWMDRTVLEQTRTRLVRDDPESLLGLDLMERVSFFINGGGATVSHVVPRFADVLEKGLLRMIDEAAARQAACTSSSDPLSGRKTAFYQAAVLSMHGILNYASRLREEAHQRGFQEITEVLTRVPAHPAQTFHEAIQTVWLCHVAILAENVNMAMSPGRLDQVLWPYFRADCERGRLSIEQALELIGCLWFKIADNTNLVPESAEKMFGGAGSVPAVTVGGVDRGGEDAVNDLTFLMLHATELLCIRDPNVNARIHPGKNSNEYIDRVARTILTTRAIPAVYNDEVVIASLQEQGVELEDARDYAIVGCVEPTTSGCSYAETSAVLLNLTAAMDMTLNEGKRPPFKLGDREQINPDFISLNELDAFPGFLRAFDMQLTFLVDHAVDLATALGETHRDVLPVPLLSCFFVGPMDKGIDLSAGGAKYNSSGATHVGFADVCDSLAAVEALSEHHAGDENPFELMRDAVAADFVGYEPILEFVRTQAPRFGGGVGAGRDPAQRIATWLTDRLYELYQAKRNARSGPYRPAYWTMTNHAGLGQIGGALPSGRRAKQVFSSGITPASQHAPDLLAAYLAVAKLCHHGPPGPEYPVPGGIALNMKYTPFVRSCRDSEYLSRFSDLIRGYFLAGGMQVQYTVQDYGTLLDAKLNPERYPDLIVRVSGYSAFFKDLNEAMQDELITRSQYDLHSGKAVLLRQYKEALT